jgi:hypothetical protein
MAARAGVHKASLPRGPLHASSFKPESFKLGFKTTIRETPANGNMVFEYMDQVMTINDA